MAYIQGEGIRDRAESNLPRLRDTVCLACDAWSEQFDSRTPAKLNRRSSFAEASTVSSSDESSLQ